MTLLRSVSIALVLASSAGAVRSLPRQEQEPAKPGKEQEKAKDDDKPKLPEGHPMTMPEIGGMNADQQEMVRLFHEVEQKLASIDVELYDASAGRIPPPEGQDSGIDRLLRSHGEKSDEAVAGIERILELAQKMGGQSCGQCMKPGSPGPGKDGQSPLDKERTKGPTQDEKTPEAPKPESKGEKKDQPKPGGEKPDDRGKNPPTGVNRPSQPRVDESGKPVAVSEDSERWGNLPERVRQVFQNQITDDMPIQYRDWIDSYYRRLNRTR